jgi:RNA recognition motif-containing protein
VTTAVFEQKAEVVEDVKEAPVEQKVAEVVTEEDDSSKTQVADTQADELDVSTVTSEPDYVNVSVRKDAPVEKVPEEEPAPKEVKEVVPEPVVVKEKPKPASWACLFAGGTPEPAQEAPKPVKKAPVRKEATDADKAVNPSAKPVAVGPPLTVYIYQLPENVVDEELRTLFEPFGAIKKIDIYVAKGFAFVDFVEASGVKNAMAKKGTGHFTIRGSAIQVEERHTKGAGTGPKTGNNRNGRVGGGSSGGNRQTGQNKTGDKKGDNKGGNNNNRNKTGNKTGNIKPPTSAK